MYDTMREYLTDEAITNADRDNMAVYEYMYAFKDGIMDYPYINMNYYTDDEVKTFKEKINQRLDFTKRERK